jgi:hypothetical protein
MANATVKNLDEDISFGNITPIELKRRQLRGFVLGSISFGW